MAEGESGGRRASRRRRKGKKKLIIMVVVLAADRLRSPRSMTVLKPPAADRRRRSQAKEADGQLTLENLCASHNGLAPPKPPRARGANAKPDRDDRRTTTVRGRRAPPVRSTHLDSITINLADGHFLKVGLALQVPTGRSPTTVKTTENWGSGAQLRAHRTAQDDHRRSRAKTLERAARSSSAARSNSDRRRANRAEDRRARSSRVYFTDFVMQ